MVGRGKNIKVILSNSVNSSLAWAARDPVSKNQNLKQTKIAGLDPGGAGHMPSIPAPSQSRVEAGESLEFEVSQVCSIEFQDSQGYREVLS